MTSAAIAGSSPPTRARKVVEHWDVLQVVPETSANDNSISRSGVHPHGGR